MLVMTRAHNRSPLMRTALCTLGVILIAATPLIGIVPGPGGIFVFAAGMVLILRNSDWAQRQFARAKKRWPRFGHYADMALRRQSFHSEDAREGLTAMLEKRPPKFTGR